MKQRHNSNLAIFLASLLACALCAGAALQDKGANEKLLTAIRDFDAQAVSALLLGGADANARDDDGLTALMYAAIYAGADCVELLLVKGADPNAKSRAEVTALMLAIGDAGKVRLLLAKGAEVNAKSKQGHTALSIAAAREGSAEVVKALLDHGAALTGINSLGAAALNGDVQVVKLLLEKGADPNDVNKLGGSPPASAKRAEELKKIAGTRQPPLRFGTEVNIGGTPLMYAAVAGNTEILKLLLEKGVDIKARSNSNGTALILAAQMGKLGAVRLLLEKGSEVNASDDWGYTALMYAAASVSNDPELSKALLARGAEINVKAKDGETALKLAGRKGRTEIVRLLKQAGAKE